MAALLIGYARCSTDEQDLTVQHEGLASLGVTKLDRLGGAVHDPTDPVGRLLFNVLAMVAEFEADLIRLRTREGVKVAKAKGRLRGKQPKLNPRQEAHMVALLKSGEYSSAELGDLFGVARSTVYRAVERDSARKRAQRQTTASIH